jgi:hypothetical protein
MGVVPVVNKKWKMVKKKGEKWKKKREKKDLGMHCRREVLHSKFDR